MQMEENLDKSLSSYTLAALTVLVKEIGQPAFRAKQIYSWLHQKQACSFAEMTNLPAALRQQLSERFTLDVLTVSKKQCSQDGTIKYLLQLRDGNCIETVLMRYNHGNTLCVSSQVGCRMGCKFCASTQGGLVRSLSAGEIAVEVYAVMRDSGFAVNNIVLMGIGEPLDNFTAVLDFIEIITSPEGLDISGRGISLSTCGIVPKVEQLAKYKLPLTLSVSLHAADNTKRSAMMPVNDAWPLESLIPACRHYFEETGRRISFEYAMVHGVNDTQEDADKLAKLVKGFPAHINLIPINPVDGSPYGPSDEQNIKDFSNRLAQRGLNVTIRRRLGTDISAACGQLRQQEKA